MLFSGFFSPLHPAESSVLQYYNATCSALLQTILPEKNLTGLLLTRFTQLMTQERTFISIYIILLHHRHSLLGAHITL